jgi:signal transduction histidine kinase
VSPTKWHYITLFYVYKNLSKLNNARDSFPEINLHVLLRWIASPSSVGFPLIIFLLIYPVVIGSFQEYAEGLEIALNFQVFDFLGGLGTAVGIIGLKYLAQNVTDQSKRTILVIFGWLVSGLIGTLLQYFSALALGPVPSIYAQSIPAGIVSKWVLCFSFAVFATVLLENRNQTRELSRARGDLEFLQENVNSKIAQSQSRITESVSSIINPVLTEISKDIEKLSWDPSANKEEAAKKLESASMELVRPLGHKLFNPGLEDAENSLKKIDQLRQKIPLLMLLNRKIRLSVVFNPALVSVLIIGFFGSSFFFVAGLPGFLIGCLATTAVSGLVLEILRRTSRNTYLRAPAVSFIGITSGFSVSLLYVLIPMVTNLKIDFSYLLFVAFGATLVLVLTPIFTLLYDTLQFALAERDKSNLARATLVARSRQEVWQKQKQIAKIVHGSVQSRLNAARIKLRQASELSPELLASVVQDLDLAKQDLEPPNQETSYGLERQLDELAEFWKGVCEVEINIFTSSAVALAKDSSATQAVVEVVSDGISNAVKHANAKTTKVEVSTGEGSSVIVRVSNPANEIHKQRSGLGTMVLNQLAIYWSLENALGQTTLEAKLALRS